MTATALSTSVSLTGGTLGVGGNCSFSVNVKGASVGVKNNTTGQVNSTQTGAGSTSNTASITVTSSSLDIDASGAPTKYDALTDGVLIIRYLFGLTGTPLTAGALGGTATRFDPAAIKTYLDGIRPALDIDDDGTVDAVTDGLLILRRLFGLSGASLIQGAIGSGANRQTAAAIESYLGTLMP